MANKPKALIFLDIHGVLTNASSTLAYNDKDRLDPVSVRLVQKLCEYCHAAIIITSSIRNHVDGVAGVDEWLCENGGKKLVKHVVAALNTDGKSTATRGTQIAAALIVEDKDRPYIIIDDHPELMMVSQAPRVIKCDPEYGFRVDAYERAIELLSRPE